MEQAEPGQPERTMLTHTPFHAIRPTYAHGEPPHSNEASLQVALSSSASSLRMQLTEQPKHYDFTVLVHV